MDTKSTEVDQLGRALAGAQGENRQLVVDLQAHERTVDAVSRELRAKEAEVSHVEGERHALLEQLRNAKGVAVQLDAGQMGLRREVAMAESHCQMLQRQLREAAHDVQGLETRLEAHQVRTTNDSIHDKDTMRLDTKEGTNEGSNQLIHSYMNQGINLY